MEIKLGDIKSTEFVLYIVDDEEDIVELIREGMQDSFPNAQVLGAHSAEDALAIIKKGYTPTIVLTDMKMGGMSGIDFANKAKTICPEAKFLLYSQFVETVEMIHLIEAGFVDFLSKPLPHEELVKSVEAILLSNKYSNTDYKLIKQEDFANNDRSPLDVYIMIGELSFVQVLKKNEKIDMDKVMAFSEQWGSQFFIRKEDSLI